MRFAPLVAAFALAAGLVGFSAATGQLPPGKADRSPAAELAKFRGDWSVTKADIPPGIRNTPPELAAEILKTLTLSISGNRISATIAIPGRPKDTGHLLMKVDPTQNPAQIDLLEANEAFEPRRSLPTRRTTVKNPEPTPNPPLKGIYKFEGDGLVLALPSSPDLGRPTAFKTVAPTNPDGRGVEQHGVSLIYLGKKK